MNSLFVKISMLLSIFLAIGCQSKKEMLEHTMQKSIKWMWSQQSENGGWHSQTHSVLKDGKALTPYILYHLLLIPEAKFKRPEGAVESGVEFIRREIIASMTVSADSLSMLNYPNYSAAYALRVLCCLKTDTTLQRIIAEHLMREQFIEHRGITSDNLAFGGWGYGEPGLPYGGHGHVDISHTRRVIESLILYDSSLLTDFSVETDGQKGGRAEGRKGILHTPPSKGAGGLFTLTSQNSLLLGQRSLIAESISDNKCGVDSRSHALTFSRLFLQGVQRTPEDPRLYEGCLSRKALPYDGGFISSAVTLATNKSEPVFIPGAGHHYPSYATATCDGLLALHALGMTETQAYADAKQWLVKNQNISTMDGLSKDDPEQWYQVMHYYHCAVRAEAMTVAGIKECWSKQLTQMLIKEQQPDGYYINPIGGVNKEDDPLMATIFAVQAGWNLSNDIANRSN